MNIDSLLAEIDSKTNSWKVSRSRHLGIEAVISKYHLNRTDSNLVKEYASNYQFNETERQRLISLSKVDKYSKKAVLIGAAVGALTYFGTGLLFSNPFYPIVFGLNGAIIGGVVGYVSSNKFQIPEDKLAEINSNYDQKQVEFRNKLREDLFNQ